MPLSISLNEFSINLAINGAEPIVNGTIVAVVPIFVPTISFAKGAIATIHIIKGNDLSVFVKISSIL